MEKFAIFLFVFIEYLNRIFAGLKYLRSVEIILGSLNKFPDFFVWALLLIVLTWNSSPLRSNLLWLQCTCIVPITSGRSHGSPLVWACQWPSSQPLSSQLSHNDSLWALGITKSHREQGLDYRKGEELSWYPSWSNSLWQGWSCGLVHCPAGNATEPIWRVLASSDGISYWTPLKPQNNIPCWLSSGKPVHVDHASAVKKRDHQKFVGGFALSGLLGSGRASMFPLGTVSWSLGHSRSCFHCMAFFKSLKQNFIAYLSSKFRLHFWNSPAVTIRL